jgi:hypothetical protein
VQRIIKNGWIESRTEVKITCTFEHLA